MVKYKKILLSKIKLLLSYYIKFLNDRSILSRIYHNNCIVKRLNQKLIIIIIYNKNIFSINDDC